MHIRMFFLFSILVLSFIEAKEKVCNIPLLNNIQVVDQTLNNIDTETVNCLLISTNSNDIYLLAVLYFKGIFVEQNFVLGEKFLKKSANDKHMRGMFDYAIFLLNKADENGAKYWLEQSANLGYAPAQTTLGVIYLYRSEYENAYLLTKQAADQGDSIALLNLSKFYFDGIFVGKDIKYALSLLEKSAELESSEAQFKLATIYYRGLYPDIDTNVQKAFYWMKKAADQHNPLAMNNLAEFYLSGVEVEKNSQYGYELINQLAQEGYCYAQYNLAVMYDYGLGVAQDHKKAQYWYAAIIKDSKIPVDMSLLSKLSFSQLSNCTPENTPIYFINIKN